MLAAYFHKPREPFYRIYRSLNRAFFSNCCQATRLAVLITILTITSACSNKPNIEITLVNEELVTTYSLEAPVNHVKFLTSDSVSRANTTVISIAEEKVTNETIEFKKAVKNFEIQFSADKAPKDRIYPNFVKINQNVAVINLDGLLIQTASENFKIIVNNAIDPKTKECEQKLNIDPFADYPEKFAIGRYVIISRTHDQCVQVSNKLRDNQISTGFYFNTEASELIDQVNVNWTLLSSQYPYIKNISQPTVLLAMLANAPKDSWQGDAGWYSTIFLREYGPSSTADRFDKGEQSKFIAHELVHLWIGKYFPVKISKASQKPAVWLSEGAAEYTAVLNSHKLGRLNTLELKTKLETAINGCMKKVDGRFIEDPYVKMNGRIPYDCGVMFQYLFDLSLRHNSRQKNNIFDFWTNFLEQLDRNNDKTIYVEHMLSSIEGNNALLSNLVFGPQFDYLNLAEIFNNVNIEVNIGRNSKARPARTALVFYILENTCPGNGFGFHGLENHIELDVGKCDLLTNNFPVENVNGFKVNSEASSALLNLESVCNDSQRGMIHLNESSNRYEAIQIPCPKTAVPSLKELSIISDPLMSKSK